MIPGEVVPDGKDLVVGWAGELHPRVCATLHLPERTCAMEISLAALAQYAEPLEQGPPVSAYPVATRDVALLVPADVPAAEVESALRSGAGDLLESLRLFDVYAGSELGEGRRSLAYRMWLRADDRTLTTEEANQARDAAIARGHASSSARSRGPDAEEARCPWNRLDRFERYPLLFGPSPVHPLDRLSAHLGGARIWAKREDCNSGLAYGGNKTRKLEYLVPDALAAGADTLVSIGGIQSNHTRQVAAVAARVGLKAVLVQESWVDWPDAVNDKVGNILLSRIMGADVRLVRAEFGIGFKDSWTQALEDVRAAGGTPYPIPAGASDHPLGGLGFARWAYEVQEQERAARGVLRPDHRVQRHRQHARRHDRRLRRPGPAAARARHRRLGEARRDQGAGGQDRP